MTSRWQWRKSLLLGAVIACLTTESLAFRGAVNNLVPSQNYGRGRRQRTRRITSAAAAAASTEEATSEAAARPTPSSDACYYRRRDGPWKPRKELGRLSIGERVFATRLPGSDLLDGKSGPKVFLECGIGKRNSKGKWSIVNGMVRIGRKGMKKSVVRKKIKRMPSTEMFNAYVSKIDLDEGRLEVCLNRDEAFERGSAKGKTPASALKVGEELTGIVRQVKPYGVFVNVDDANRNGLLHISKVANRYDAYVDKEEGLKKRGLKRGSSVNVVVLSNDKKRLEFDLAPEPEESPPEAVVAADAATNDGAKDEGSEGVDADDDEAAMWAAYAANDSVEDTAVEEEGDVVDDEAAMWAAYAAPDYTADEGGEDDYDEDADIEDALGIGSY